MIACITSKTGLVPLLWELFAQIQLEWGDGGWKAKKEKKLSCTSIKSRLHGSIWLLSVINSDQLWQLPVYWGIFWLNWMALGLFYRFVFILNFWQVNHFLFLGWEIHHFWWKEYFPFSQVQFSRYQGTCGNKTSTSFWVASIPSLEYRSRYCVL